MSPTDGTSGPLVPRPFVTEIVTTAGAAGAAWIEKLPALVAESCERWSLTIDGASMHGVAGLVVPVTTAAGVRAVLKVSWPHEEAAAESTALHHWAGAGAVRLLDDHAGSWSLLLERLDSSRSLEDLADPDAAVDSAAALLPRLHVACPNDIPTVCALAERWIEELPTQWERLGRPIDRSLVDEALVTCRDLGSAEPVRLLHGDFHYANVLAGEREPWLAIDPKPLAGDPAFDIGPLLRNRWEDLTCTIDVVTALRRRFDQIVEVAALDRDRARAWAVTRAVDNVLYATEQDDPAFAQVERTIAETFGS